MYEREIITETFTLKRDSVGDFELYDKKNEEMSVNWTSGTFSSEQYTFEIVEEKIPDDLKNALKTMGKYCKSRECSECAFNKGVRYGSSCNLIDKNPYLIYKTYIGGGEDE